MISDVLFDSAEQIREYLYEEPFKQCYDGPIREGIEKLLLDMDKIRVQLDRHPDWIGSEDRN